MKETTEFTWLENLNDMLSILKDPHHEDYRKITGQLTEEFYWEFLEAHYKYQENPELMEKDESEDRTGVPLFDSIRARCQSKLLIEEFENTIGEAALLRAQRYLNRHDGHVSPQDLESRPSFTAIMAAYTND